MINIDYIVEAACKEFQNLPSVAEEFFQATAWASSPEEFYEIARDFLPDLGV